jgi:DNA-binding Xre family transcriptional regulator
VPKRKPIEYYIDDKGCHICTSHALRNGVGYPTTCLNGRATSVVRYLWIKAGRDIPEGQVTRHTCDNPVCVNLDHIVLGTSQENNQDKMDRGRCPMGEDVNTAKLTEAQVREIVAHPEVSSRELAKQYGITRINVNYIRSGQTWKSVTGLKETHRGKLVGESHGMCKITEEQAVYVLDNPDKSLTELARQFGVTIQNIYRIRKRLIWKSISPTQIPTS